MKNACLIGAAVSLCLVSSVFASDICVAQKDERASYASTMRYQVNCKSESFKTPFIVTTVILPLPYNWGGTARRKLYSLMTAKGYALDGKIDEVSENQEFSYGFNKTGTKKVTLAFEDSVLIFSRSKQNLNYCGVIKGNPQSIGLDQKRTIYDFIVSCSQRSVHERILGVTQQEFDDYMGKLNMRLNMNVKYLGGEYGSYNGTLEIFEEAN